MRSRHRQYSRDCLKIFGHLSIALKNLQRSFGKLWKYLNLLGAGMKSSDLDSWEALEDFRCNFALVDQRASKDTTVQNYLLTRPVDQSRFGAFSNSKSK